ncbi:hypothetical protein ACVMIL_004423 [Bradyrhizobium barranii subsp. barranii]
MQQKLQGASDRIAADGADDRARIVLHRHEEFVEEPDARPSDVDPDDFLDVAACAEEAVAASGEHDAGRILVVGKAPDRLQQLDD